MWDAFDQQDTARQPKLIQILAQYSALKDVKAYEELAATGGLNGASPNGDFDLSKLEAVLNDHFLKRGYVTEKVDPATLFDRSYLDSALQRLGRV